MRILYRNLYQYLILFTLEKMKYCRLNLFYSHLVYGTKDSITVVIYKVLRPLLFILPFKIAKAIWFLFCLIFYSLQTCCNGGITKIKSHDIIVKISAIGSQAAKLDPDVFSFILAYLYNKVNFISWVCIKCDKTTQFKLRDSLLILIITIF